MRCSAIFGIILGVIFLASCALKEVADENLIQIEGRYEFISMDFSIFEKLNIQPLVQPISNGEAIFDKYHRFRAQYVDPILNKEIVNLDGEFIIRRNRIIINLPQARLNGNFKISNRRGETRLMITWKIEGDSKLYNWVLRKK